MRSALLLILPLAACSVPPRQVAQVNPCDVYRALSSQRGYANGWDVWQAGQMCARMAAPPMLMGSMIQTSDQRLVEKNRHRGRGEWLDRYPDDVRLIPMPAVVPVAPMVDTKPPPALPAEPPIPEPIVLPPAPPARVEPAAPIPAPVIEPQAPVVVPTPAPEPAPEPVVAPPAAQPVVRPPMRFLTPPPRSVPVFVPAPVTPAPAAPQPSPTPEIEEMPPGMRHSRLPLLESIAVVPGR